MAAVRSVDLVTRAGVLSGQGDRLLRQLHALADARAATSITAVESLLVTAAELRTRADLSIVDAAEKPSPPADAEPASAVTGQSSPGQTPPQTVAG